MSASAVDDVDYLNILHIEDDDIDAKIIKTSLEQSTLNIQCVDVVKSISAALEYLYAKSVDLILLDLNLSDSRGLDTLKDVHIKFPSIAILIVTGADDEDIALKSVALGAQEYLVKDFISSYTIARGIQYALERNRHEQELFRTANTDSLTQLPNRGHFMVFLSEYLQRPNTAAENFALIYFNCDNFKLVNDTMGHTTADEILMRLAALLNSCISATDFIARVGGDEFVVALNVSKRDDLSPRVIVENIFEMLQDGFLLRGGEKVNLSCSVGITKTKGNKRNINADEMMNQAVSAMFAAKKRGGNNYFHYNKSIEQQALRRVHLLRIVNRAFVRGEFHLNYQLIYNGVSSSPSGMEALARWKTESGEQISPLEFIPVLEETALIFPVGFWVIRQACVDYLSLVNSGRLSQDAWVSVNVSPTQLQDERFSQRVEEILLELGMRPFNLHLEVTETLMMERKDILLRELCHLKKLGCRLSIDDFGVGYSSMNYLKELPFDTLKIDQSFILSFSNKKQEKAILKAMIALAHNLGKKVVAEGIENQKTAEFLIGQKCDYLQGFFFAKPVNIEKVTSNLTPISCDNVNPPHTIYRA